MVSHASVRTRLNAFDRSELGESDPLGLCAARCHHTVVYRQRRKASTQWSCPAHALR